MIPGAARDVEDTDSQKKSQQVVKTPTSAKSPAVPAVSVKQQSTITIDGS